MQQPVRFRVVHDNYAPRPAGRPVRLQRSEEQVVVPGEQDEQRACDARSRIAALSCEMGRGAAAGLRLPVRTCRRMLVMCNYLEECTEECSMQVHASCAAPQSLQTLQSVLNTDSTIPLPTDERHTTPTEEHQAVGCVSIQTCTCYSTYFQSPLSSMAHPSHNPWTPAQMLLTLHPINVHNLPGWTLYNILTLTTRTVSIVLLLAIA